MLYLAGKVGVRKYAICLATILNYMDDFATMFAELFRALQTGEVTGEPLFPSYLKVTEETYENAKKRNEEAPQPRGHALKRPFLRQQSFHAKRPFFRKLSFGTF